MLRLVEREVKPSKSPRQCLRAKIQKKIDDWMAAPWSVTSVLVDEMEELMQEELLRDKA